MGEVDVFTKIKVFCKIIQGLKSSRWAPRGTTLVWPRGCDYRLMASTVLAGCQLGHLLCGYSHRCDNRSDCSATYRNGHSAGRGADIAMTYEPAAAYRIPCSMSTRVFSIFNCPGFANLHTSCKMISNAMLPLHAIDRRESQNGNAWDIKVRRHSIGIVNLVVVLTSSPWGQHYNKCSPGWCPFLPFLPLQTPTSPLPGAPFRQSKLAADCSRQWLHWALRTWLDGLVRHCARSSRCKSFCEDSLSQEKNMFISWDHDHLI